MLHLLNIFKLECPLLLVNFSTFVVCGIDLGNVVWLSMATYFLAQIFPESLNL